MITIALNYTPTCAPISDFDIQEIIANVIAANKHTIFDTCSELIVYYLRTLHKKGEINLKLYHRGQPIPINERGQFIDNNPFPLFEEYYKELTKETPVVLEKEPKKAEKQTVEFDGSFYTCPRCKGLIDSDEDEREHTVDNRNYTIATTYECPSCNLWITIFRDSTFDIL